MRRLWATGLALIACSVWAQENLVSAQAQASREVDNDQLVAVLAAEAQGSDPATQLARDFPAVKLRSGNYQTYPRYREQRIDAWHGSQELRLESADFATAARLIGTLQKDLVVRSMFQARAELARKSLRAKGYRLRNLSVDTAAAGPPIPLATMARAQSSLAPLEPGVSHVVVTVSGTVQLD